MMEPAFAHAGKVQGLEIWRIEDFKPVAYPKGDYGKFHVGDSYIVLNTKGDNGKEGWDIHFWLGAETTQDEAGTAAILSVALDEMLGGFPVQYREVQEHETQQFLSLFQSGVRYVPGGVASGFTTVDKSYTKRMYHVKGRKNIRVKQVEPKVSNMNRGDCFILDTGDMLFVFQGPESQKGEQIKANHAAVQIRDQDHGGRSDILIIDSYSDHEDVQKFFTALGEGSLDEIPDASAGGDDMAEEKTGGAASLYKISDASGNLTFEKIADGSLQFSMLDTSDCFLVDAGNCIFVWIGKNSNKDEKKHAMAKATDYLKEKNYPAWTQIQRIVEGGESATFKQYVK